MSDAVTLIARREIVTRLQQRGYRIGLLVTLLIAVVAVLLPSFFSGGDSGPKTYHVAVAHGPLDPTRVSGVFVRALRVTAAQQDARVTVFDQLPRSEARADVDNGRYDAVLDGSHIIAKHQDDTIAGIVQQAERVTTTVTRLTDRGVSLDQAFAALNTQPLPVQATESGQQTQRQTIAIITVVFLFSQLITFCTWVATGVVEEKSSRVVELLLSSVRPIQLLAGKLLGIGALAAGQVLLLGGAALITATASGSLTLPASDLLTVLISFVAFLLGFAFFAAVAAALASTVSRQEEVSGVLAPVTISLTVCYFIAFAAAQNSDSSLFRVLSVIPPISSIAMPARIAQNNVSVGEVLLAAVLLIAAAAFVLAFAARIYRASVLHMGTRLKLRQAWSGEAVAATPR